ncbi:MAG: energy transducer TonB [Bacteroidetes bacterium]|nr:energy transducer TonB [Fibrella sp.]
MLWLFTLIALAAHTSRAQPTGVQPEVTLLGYELPGSVALNDDPVFNRVLSRRVSYPVMALRSATYGRVYAGFDIDARGHLRNVAILGPENTGVGFEYEVRTALKRMPPLHPRYAGRYVLPVSFVLTNSGERAEPYVPTQTRPRRDFGDRLLLGDVIFRGSVRSETVPVRTSQEIRYH